MTASSGTDTSHYFVESKNKIRPSSSKAHYSTLNSLSHSESAGFIVDPKSYLRAEKRANWYLQDLLQLIANDDYLLQLNNDYKQWQKQTNRNVNTGVSLSTLEGEQQISEQIDSWSFLEKLAAEKKLKAYLNKSVTYIFMRDLGKSISDKSSKKKIEATVDRLHQWVKKQTGGQGQVKQQGISKAWLFKKAREAGVETTLYWLMNKLALVQKNMPTEIDQTNGMRKLVKIIAGVVLHQFVDMLAEMSDEDKRHQLDRAIRLGYSYGLTYPFVDDLQDSASALDAQEKEVFNQAIRESLLKGKVVTCPKFSQKNQAKMSFIYKELSEAFDSIKSYQSAEESKLFFEQAYIFFEAQDIDRRRKLEGNDYSTEALFLPIILKSSGCRLIARELLSSNNDESFNYHTFCFGIYNQFNDDIKDIFDDLAEDNVTPYTYYLKQLENGNEKSLVNPYRVYWSVVFYLIHKVYKGHPQSKQLLLERSINAHKSLRAAIGEGRYQQLRGNLLSTGNADFDQLIDKLVSEPNDVAWFDKLVSRQVSSHFEQTEAEQQVFKDKYQQVKSFVDEAMPLSKHPKLKKSTLVEGANYSLQAGGKRLRAVLAYVMCVDKYKTTPEQSVPVLQLLEYMHTASIIFDDKPSQDDSDIRRGLPTLHKHCQSEATAELTGVFMMMRAVEVQSQIKGFAPENVLKSLAYAASTTQAICEGQLLDLQSKSQRADIKQLELISELKTGLAIEASMMIPAILAGENDIEKGHIKQFARHLGLAFQIKDDLLDHYGDAETLGKPVQQDSNIDKASFVTCLGEASAQQKLYEHYYQAAECLQHLGEVKRFMGQVLEFVVHRES